MQNTPIQDVGRDFKRRKRSGLLKPIKILLTVQQVAGVAEVSVRAKLCPRPVLTLNSHRDVGMFAAYLHIPPGFMKTGRKQVFLLLCITNSCVIFTLVISTLSHKLC